jgi:sugar phosphate isomerase/epimerase
MAGANNFPKLHNAMWPGLVGKGEDSEPPIDLDTMIDMTAKANVDGVKFDGIDIFLSLPHTPIDVDDDGIKRLADKVSSRGLAIGTTLAPVWKALGGGSAIGPEEERKNFVFKVRRACEISKRLRDLGVRTCNVVRIDTAATVSEFDVDPVANTKLAAQTFREACDVAEGYGERLACEGEICWGGMHSWRYMIDTMEETNRPNVIGFQADMAHTMLYMLGYNALEHRILPEGYDWKDKAVLDAAMKTMTDALRPWTIDIHVSQNDGTVKGIGYHDKTGHHCLPGDPNGKLDVPYHAGFWLRDNSGQLTKALQHICWDGCMFSNETMMEQQTWNDILEMMIKVRDKHGWQA